MLGFETANLIVRKPKIQNKASVLTEERNWPFCFTVDGSSPIGGGLVIPAGRPSERKTTQYFRDARVLIASSMACQARAKFVPLRGAGAPCCSIAANAAASGTACNRHESIVSNRRTLTMLQAHAMTTDREAQRCHVGKLNHCVDGLTLLHAGPKHEGRGHAH